MTNIADASVGGWVCEGSEQRPMMRTHTCYASLDLAKADGALTLNHGVFLAVRSHEGHGVVLPSCTQQLPFALLDTHFLMQVWHGSAG
jgi:hypothetical protein